MELKRKSDEIDVRELDERLEREVEKGKAGIKNCTKILLADAVELRKLAIVTDDDINLLKQLAADSILPNYFVPAIHVNTRYTEKWKTIPLDCPGIDSILGGGIPTRGITELYGVSSAGKTQFCLQFAITVQYPVEHQGRASGCVYICTEDQFPSRRLQQLLPQFPRKNLFDPKLLASAADNIFVDHIPDMVISLVPILVHGWLGRRSKSSSNPAPPQPPNVLPNKVSLNECLKKRLPVLLQNRKIGLLIVDSIAAIFRSDYTSGQFIQRAQDMRVIGQQLHELAAQYGIAVLCVNQVTDSVDTNETMPALGLAWANLVTTKLRVEVLPNKNRLFSVVSSPELESSSCEYRITSGGIEDVL